MVIEQDATSLEGALELAAIDVASLFIDRNVNKPISIYGHGGNGQKFRDLLGNAFRGSEYVPELTITSRHVDGSYGIELMPLLKRFGYRPNSP